MQLTLMETHCNTCKHYSPGGFGGYIVSSNNMTYVPGDSPGCNLHDTIVLPYSKACDNYEM